MTMQNVQPLRLLNPDDDYNFSPSLWSQSIPKMVNIEGENFEVCWEESGEEAFVVVPVFGKIEQHWYLFELVHRGIDVWPVGSFQ